MNAPTVNSNSSYHVDSLNLSRISKEEWDALLPSHNPFATHTFLQSLEESGAVSADTGWIPQHVGVWKGEKLVAALPCYEKSHSWGEYVFDWQWADAWERAGGEYYPKLISAMPFTPSAGPRLLHAPDVSMAALVKVLTPWLKEYCGSSWHLLFPYQHEQQAWEEHWPELLSRRSVQYHWHNRGYDSFDDFLARFTSKRRKEVRRERRKVAEQGFTLRRLSGKEIDQQALRQFYRCYQITYLERGQSGYLPFSFFELLRDRMPEQLTLVQALHPAVSHAIEEEHTGSEGRETAVAAALFFHDDECLYGRYWGSEVAADSLHFEVCYYQGIEFAIEHGFKRFDPGTQGEHKIPRGFEPCFTYSSHWITSPDLRAAIDDFLKEESRYIELRLEQAATLLPYRHE